MQTTLSIYRSTDTLATVDIDESTIYSGEHLGMDKVTASFVLPHPIELKIDDYIIHNGSRYKIKTATQGEQIDSKTYRYEPVFYGEIYDLYDELIMHLGRTKFDYTGTPLDLLGLIIDCLNSENPGWSIGDCSLISEPATFSFSEQSCRVALSEVAERFKLEYRVKDKKIYLIEKVGTVHDITLKYGRGQGLYSASRNPVDQPYATVWYGFGGNKNLPADYKNGMDRISLDTPVEVNTNLYGRKKGSVTFEDEYPKRTGTISAVNGLNEVADVDLDFDINAQQITEGGAKIVFKTGELGGQEFVISSYNHTTKTIRFKSNKDDTGYTTPNSTFNAKVGDKYTLVGIVMPQSYLDDCEARVLQLTQEHAAKHSFPPVAFPLNMDEKYIREMGLAYVLQPGDSLTVVSESLGINTPLRLQSLSYPLVNPAKITGTVSDVVQYSVAERIVKDVIQGKKEISKAQATALFARQVADEIKNAAILEQFRQTYVGEKAVLSGAFVVGNPEDGEVGGINGSGTDPEEIGFWLGETFENRDEAPFRVNYAGEVSATAGEIGGWNLSIDKIISGDPLGDYIELQSGESPRIYMKNASQGSDQFNFSKIDPKGIHMSSEGTALPGNYKPIKAVAAFKLNEFVPDGEPRAALFLHAQNEGMALYSEGNIYIDGLFQVTGPSYLGNEIYTDGLKGISTTITYKGSSREWDMTIKNGLIVNHE